MTRDMHSAPRFTGWRGVLGLATFGMLWTAANSVPAYGQRPATAPALVFDRVTVVDVEHGRLLPGRRVVVVGSRIQAVGAAGTVKAPRGARVVDAAGKYLIPGLWDMHVHVDSFARQKYPQFIAYGVTGIREMAQRFPFGADSFRVWQREVMAGTRVGPRSVGPSADVTVGNGIEIKTPEDAARVMDSLKAAGVVFVKYHGSGFGNASTNRPLFFAIAREARRVGLPLVGHTQGNAGLGSPARPFTVVEAADSGLRSIEHIVEDHQCWRRIDGLRRGGADSAASAEACVLVAQAYLRNGTWVTPTLAINEVLYASDAKVHEHLQARMRVYMREMRRLGFQRFLAGSDVSEDPVVPKYPLHRAGLALLWELVLLTDAGLTPSEALQAATLHPAQFFAMTDSLGSVATGKLADLVLLDADPLADIRNVVAIRAVVANGRYFDRAALDALDPERGALMKQVAEYGRSASPGTLK